MIFTNSTMYKKCYLSKEEIVILNIVSYLKDKEHGLGNTEDFNNIMMDNNISSVVDSLLTKVDHNLESIFIKIPI